MKSLFYIESDVLAQYKFIESLTGFKFTSQVGDLSGADLAMLYRPDGLLQLVERELKPNGKGFKERVHLIDIYKFIKSIKTYPASKKDLLARAVGKNNQSIIDATGGWGGDSLQLCSQGYQVNIVERHPLLTAFLRNAFECLAETDWVQKHSVFVPILRYQDSIQFLQTLSKEVVADCIYLDPMFPDKSKTALAKKNMQILHDLVGKDADQEALFVSAYQSPVKRIVVKRPLYAESLGKSLNVSPSERIKGKLLFFDVYLK